MIKDVYLKSVNSILPNEIKLIDNLSFDINEDEFISLLSWIKFLKSSIDNNGKTQKIHFNTPLISKRILLDLAFYNIKDDNNEYCIYLVENKEKNINQILLNNFI